MSKHDNALMTGAARDRICSLTLVSLDAEVGHICA